MVIHSAEVNMVNPFGYLVTHAYHKDTIFRGRPVSSITSRIQSRLT